MRIIQLKLILVFISILFTKDMHGQTSYVIIINNNNPTISLSKKEIANLFLKKTTWKDNHLSMPVDLLANSEIRKRFTQDIHGKSVAAIRNYWQQTAFSGKTTIPPEKENDLEVIRFVKNNPTAIGYISISSLTNEIKTLKIKP